MYTYWFQKPMHAGASPATLTMEHKGKHSCYSLGCREPECCEAHRIYTLEQKWKRRNLDWLPPIDTRLVRAKIRLLKRNSNIGVIALAQKTGISARTLCKIKNGQVQWVRGATAIKVFSVEENYYVRCVIARKHLQWLSDNGIGAGRVSLVTGIPQATLDQIRNGKTKFTYHDNVTKILGVGLHMFQNWRGFGPGIGIGVKPDYLFRERVS